ncbi:MacB-like periplasmic core domain protein [Prevotella sp. BV3P1]|uniref:ABC transporter permease n=1 Tax=Prevotellaceae TaxID=171552 RepID=UPI0003B8A6CA|nr:MULTISPECIES: ABC transporter permease [Prevotellaceae]ERT60592.1 MacB-like periplasmic core domain protein [Prevotella sp. BV3P1]KGF42006.1 ABC transporter permease [Hoylesella buccalis DNF00985]
MRDILTEIWATARRNKLRTTLTGFAVAWGIFMLIFLLGAGNGLINATQQNSNRYLNTSMVIFGGQTSKAHKGLKEGRKIELNDRDMEITQDRFSDNVEEVGAELDHGNTTMSHGKEYTAANISGVYPNDYIINKRDMIYGRFINKIDIRDRRKSIVISDDMAKELSPTGNVEDMLGQIVRMEDLAFHIVGIYQVDKSMMGTDAFIPFTTYRTIYNVGDKTGNIVFSFKGLETEQQNEAFEQRYRANLNGNHGAAPDDEEAVWIWNRFTQAMQMNTGMGMLRTALWIVGIFTLLSGIVGVSNIMLITVKERTHEFGIRKAIGATPWSILRLIIIESIIITTFFGYIGMVLGIAANEYMNATIGNMKVDSGMFTTTMFVNPTVGLDVCINATLLMVVAGTIAGLIPARKAARVRPIEALRAE